MSTNPFVPLFGKLYGSLYFGTVMSTAFYGVQCMQTFFYYVHYQNDSMPMKLYVGFVWYFSVIFTEGLISIVIIHVRALNTLHEGLSITGSYKYIMAGLVNPVAFENGNPEIILQVLPTILVTVPTRGFFIYRIYIVSGRSLVAPVLWIITAIVQLVTAILFVAKALYTANGQVQAVELLTLTEDPLMTLGTVCLAIGAGADIMIAIFMTFLLIRQRMASRFVSTAAILQRLTVFSVNTGVWPAVFSLATVILLHVFPSSLLYTVPYVPLCSVYCNTLLANLNAREYIIKGTTTMYNAGGMFVRSNRDLQTSGSSKPSTGMPSGEVKL